MYCKTTIGPALHVIIIIPSSITHTRSRQIAPPSSSNQHIVDVSDMLVSLYQSVPGSVITECYCHLCLQWILFHMEAVSHPAKPLFSYQLLCSDIEHICMTWMVLELIWGALLYPGDTAQTAVNTSFYRMALHVHMSNENLLVKIPTAKVLPLPDKNLISYASICPALKHCSILLIFRVKL